MNIFVVGTGRCGTTTFSKACGFATNKTVSHERLAGSVYRLTDYPPNHIEVDAPLSFWLPRLRTIYPGCRFVHLVRHADRSGCIDSMSSHDPDICGAFGRMLFHYPECSAREGAEAMYDVINEMVNGADVLRVLLREVQSRWHEVWEWMECDGDFEKSRSEWNVKYNATA